MLDSQCISKNVKLSWIIFKLIKENHILNRSNVAAALKQSNIAFVAWLQAIPNQHMIIS